MILPNVIRVAGIEDAEGEALFDRRGSSLNWVVPTDDTSCLTIGYSDIHKKVIHPDGAGYIDRMARRGNYAVGAADVGQTGEPSYAERQRAPGDWDAWVSQGPITQHDSETLASTDRGVLMFRNMLRRGIRKIAKGEGLEFLEPGADRVIPTYCHNTVIPVPETGSENTERDLCFRFGRDVTELVLSDAFPKDERCGASPAALAELRFRFNSR